jgi:hypothetical protein
MPKSYKRSLQQKLKAELKKTAGQASSEVLQKASTLKKKLRRKAIHFTDSAKLLRQDRGW